ncbi:MarR family winged helix-turn-helix transcriptional regulator [Pseudoroseicyclus sp. CXY001]|uniref:MarR family winged helix-turn-helix transcriptional regulator n=1 Tax=Pseudoroseicyclus sp. CXY001 TaxID=3242492 RepID=UPI003570F36D
MDDDHSDAQTAKGKAARIARQSSALYAIHEVSRLISVVYDDYVAEHGLTRARWWTLMHVGENEGASQTSIAAMLGTGRAAAGRQISKMEALGLIERRSDPNDSRVRTVYLTAKGRELLEPMEHAGYVLFAKFFRGFEEAEEKTLVQFLDRLKANAAE